MTSAIRRNASSSHPTMEGRFRSKIPRPRVGNSKFMAAPLPKSSSYCAEDGGDTSTRCSDAESYLYRETALLSLEKQIQVIMEEDDNSSYHQVSGYQNRDDYDDEDEDHSIYSEGEMADASSYVLPPQSEWEQDFGMGCRQPMGISRDAGNALEEEVDDHDCFVPQNHFMCATENIFPSECYFNPCIDDQLHSRRAPQHSYPWKQSYRHSRSVIDIPTHPTTTSRRCQPARSSSPARSRDRAPTSTVLISRPPELPFDALPWITSIMSECTYETFTESHQSSPMRDDQQPVVSSSQDHQTLPPPDEDLLTDKARNFFPGRLEGFIREKTQRISALPVPLACSTSSYHSRRQTIHKAASIVLNDIFRSNVSTRIRMTRFQRALKGRQSTHQQQYKQAIIEDSENQVPSSVETKSSVAFRVTPETRRFRLSKATRRVKFPETEAVMTHEIEAEDNATGGYWSLKNINRSPMITRLLKTRQYGAGVVKYNINALWASLMLYFFRLQANRVPALDWYLEYVFGSPVVYCSVQDRVSVWILNILMRAIETHFAVIFRPPTSEPVLMGILVASSDEMQNTSPNMGHPTTIQSESEQITICTPQALEAVSESDTESLEEELEFLYSDDVGKLAHPTLKVFVVTTMMELDLSRDSYINAHHDNPIGDLDSEDDGLALELKKLPWLQAELRRELADLELQQERQVKSMHARSLDFETAKQQALDAVCEAVPKTSSFDSKDIEEEDEEAELLGHDGSESTFDEDEARRIIQDAIKQMSPPGSQNMEMNLPLVKPCLGNGGALWKHEPIRASPEGELNIEIALYPRPAVSTLTDCAGSLSIKTGQSTNMVYSGQEYSTQYEQEYSTQYDDFPSLLSMTTLSTDENTNEDDVDENVILNLVYTAPGRQKNRSDKIERSRKSYDFMPPNTGTNQNDVQEIGTPKFSIITNSIAEGGEDEPREIDVDDNEASGAFQTTRTAVAVNWPPSAFIMACGSGSSRHPIVVPREPRDTRADKMRVGKIQQKVGRRQRRNQRNFRQKLDQKNIENPKSRSKSTMLEMVGRRLLRAFQLNAKTEKEVPEEEAMVESDSGDTSFYVVRSICSIETSREGVEQGANKNVKSPTWSLSPIVNTFSKVSEISDDTGVWSTEPNLTPNATGTSRTMQHFFSQAPETERLSKQIVSLEKETSVTIGAKLSQRIDDNGSLYDLPERKKQSINETTEASWRKGGSNSKTMIVEESNEILANEDLAIEVSESMQSQVSNISIKTNSDEDRDGRYPSFEMSVDGDSENTEVSMDISDEEDMNLHQISVDDGANIDMTLNELALPSFHSSIEPCSSSPDTPVQEDQDEKVLDILELQLDASSSSMEPQTSDQVQDGLVDNKLERDHLAFLQKSQHPSSVSPSGVDNLENVKADRPFDGSRHSYRLGGASLTYSQHNRARNNPTHNKYMGPATSMPTTSDILSREQEDVRRASPNTSQVVKDFALEVLRQSTDAHSPPDTSGHDAEFIGNSVRSTPVTTVSVASSTQHAEIVARMDSLQWLSPEEADDEDKDTDCHKEKSRKGKAAPGSTKFMNKFLSDLSDRTNPSGDTPWASSVVSSVSDEEGEERSCENTRGTQFTKPRIISMGGPVNLNAADDWDLDLIVSPNKVPPPPQPSSNRRSTNTRTTWTLESLWSPCVQPDAFQDIITQKDSKMRGTEEKLRQVKHY